jgi:hypothetical protein
VDSLRARLLEAKLMGRMKTNVMMDDVDVKIAGATEAITAILVTIV